MGMSDFIYEIPQNFNTRIIQFLEQGGRGDLSCAFQQCEYDYEDVGNAYYAGIKGDNWNMHALDFIFEGSKKNIQLLKNNESIIKKYMDKAIKSQESGFQIRDVYFFVSDNNIDVLPKSSEERLNIDMENAKSVLKDLLIIGERLCTTVEYNESTMEDTINDFFRNMLCGMGYTETKDQTHHGVSSNGIGAGEVDILITKNGKEIALFEGLKLKGVTTKIIDEHIDKAINNYNSLGTATFVVAYVTAVDYSDFWRRYFDYLSNYQYNMTIIKNITELTQPNASTKIAHIILSKGGFDFPVYFICFNIRKIR